MIKESSLYLNFLKRHYLLLIISFILPVIITPLVYKGSREIKAVNQYFELKVLSENTAQTLPSTLIYIDHLVGALRISTIAQELGISDSVEVSYLKTTPLSLKVEVRTLSHTILPSDLEHNLELVTQYVKNNLLEKNYQLVQLSQPSHFTIKPTFYKHYSIIFFFTFFSALLIALIKDYFRKY